MSRASSGTVAAVSAACSVERDLACGRRRGDAPELGLALTVGKSPDGLVGEMPVPEIAGSLAGAGKLITGIGGLLDDDTVTTSVAEPENEAALVPVAFAVS